MKRETSISKSAPSRRGVKAVLPGYESSADSFETVSRRYLKYQEARIGPAAYARERGIVAAHLRPYFGNSTKLAAIKRNDVLDYIAHRGGEVSPASINKELKLLKHLLSLAVEWRLIPGNPAHGVKAPRIPAGRVRYLQVAELRTVIGACPEWLRPIVGFAVGTGMTRGEILNLRWLDVCLRDGRINLPPTKKGVGRTVYLNSIAQQALASVARKKSKPKDLVFTGDSVTPDNVSLAFLRACREVNVSDFRFQDLRHTAASLMILQGAEISTVANFLGHRDLRTTARYQHLRPAPLSDAVKLLDAAFATSDMATRASKSGSKG